MAKKKPELFKYDIQFDSKLELQIYEVFLHSEDCIILDDHKTFLIQPTVEYYNVKRGKISKQRKMEYTTDFIIKHRNIDKPIAVEVKGYAREGYMMRKKLFIAKYHDEYNFIELKTVQEALELLSKYKP